MDLRKFREHKQMTINEMASRLGIAYGTYRDIESGRKPMSRETAQRLADNFWLVAYLADGEIVVDRDYPITPARVPAQTMEA